MTCTRKIQIFLIHYFLLWIFKILFFSFVMLMMAVWYNQQYFIMKVWSKNSGMYVILMNDRHQHKQHVYILKMPWKSCIVSLLFQSSVQSLHLKSLFPKANEWRLTLSEKKKWMTSLTLRNAKTPSFKFILSKCT